MNDLISIIIPAYNVEKYLNKCLDSVVNQTYDKLEIIIINDGSTDSTLQICNEWKQKDKRITIINQKNQGLSAARNRGIETANGQYIVFIDSDDFIDKSMIQVLYNNMISNSADISICNRYYYYEKNNKIKLRFPCNGDIKIMNKEEALMDLMCFRNFDMSVWSKMYKSSYFKNIKFPLGKYCEDYYIMYKLFDKAKTIVYDSSPLYYYLQRQGNGSITKKKELLWDYVYAAQEQNRYISKKYPNLAIYSESAFCISNLTIYNKIIVNGGKPTKDSIQILRKNVIETKKSLFQNKSYSIVRKIQIWLFLYFRHIYNLLIRIMKK